MMCSIDIEGRVVITCIVLSRLGYLKTSKLVIFDPAKTEHKKASSQKELEKYSVLRCRFFDKIFPQGNYNDSNTWVSIASAAEV